jgi:hypothetical protein
MLLLIGWIIVLLFPTNLVMVVVAGPTMAFGTVLFYATVPNIVVRHVPTSSTAECAGMAQTARSMRLSLSW